MHGKKRTSLFLVIVLTAMLLAGCSDHTNIQFKEDGSGHYEETASAPEELWDILIGEASDETVLSYYKALYPQAEIMLSDQTVDGTPYKTFHLEMDFKDLSQYEQMSSNSEIVSVKYNQNYYSRSKIFMPLEEENEMVSGISEELEQLLDPSSGIDQEVRQKFISEMQNLDVIMTITFPYTVADSNGSIAEDGKTVVWDVSKMENSERLYALFRTSNSLSAPKYQGAANGKAYNTGVSVSIDCENLLSSVDVNGEKTASNQLFLSREGIYHITATDVNGNSSNIRFRIDTTKPSISGVKDGKSYKDARTIRFSDKGSGIKKATLNGKVIQSGKKISQKGTYTLIVSDLAGNKKTITFKIK